MNIGTEHIKLFIELDTDEKFIKTPKERLMRFSAGGDNRMLIRNIKNSDILDIRNARFLRENNIKYLIEDGECIPIGLFAIREHNCDYGRQRDGKTLMYEKNIKLTYKITDDYYSIPQILKNIEKAFMLKAEALELMDYGF